MNSSAAEKSLYIAHACYSAGVRQVFIAPGSRNAPLTIAFVRYGRFSIQVVPDERCAGYMTMGAAQGKNTPAAVITTSGSAVANLYPSVTEAFYQEIPTILITADRPPDLIDQLDGQTIHQDTIFRDHIKMEFSIPLEMSPEKSGKKIFDAVSNASKGKKGPVHINIPFREPLYEELKRYDKLPSKINLVKNTETPDYKNLEAYWKKLAQYRKILIVAGQGNWSEGIITSLTKLINKNCVVLADITSNLHALKGAVHFSELIFPETNHAILQKLQPDLLISFGLSVVSKNLRVGLRAMNIPGHWHIQPEGPAPDPYQSLTDTVHADPGTFLPALGQELDSLSSDYIEGWSEHEQSQRKKVEEFFSGNQFHEMSGIRQAMESLPGKSVLHLGNSLAVRYANYIGLNRADITVFSNRGTSGIDGCVSSAVGHALSTPDRIHILIVGDISFFYDRNALWTDPLPNNLRIIVLNNHGGGIFRMIDGPETIPERDQYFVGYQPRNARLTAEDHGLKYLHADNRTDLEKGLKLLFLPSGKAMVLELETSMDRNTGFLKSLKNLLNGKTV